MIEGHQGHKKRQKPFQCGLTLVTYWNTKSSSND
jgi:hypothetical protein